MGRRSRADGSGGTGAGTAETTTASAARHPVALWVMGASLLYLGSVFALNLVSVGELAWQLPRNLGGAFATIARRGLRVAHWLNHLGPAL